MGTPDSMSDLFAFLTDLMNSNSGLFQTIGLNLFRGFAIILLVWFGAKAALGSADGRRSFHFDQFAGLVLTIAFGYAMSSFSTITTGIGRCSRIFNPYPSSPITVRRLLVSKIMFLIPRSSKICAPIP